jgi:electron transfer flavoprotein alpha subunit
MNDILIIAEHRDGKLNAATARTVACAAALAQHSGGAIHVAVLAADPAPVAAEASRLAGVAKVIAVARPEFTPALSATLAPAVVELSAAYGAVLAPSTTFGKDLLPRAAALAGCPQVSDIMAVRDARTFQRPIYAGNVLVDVQVPAGVKLFATARTASWSAVASTGSAPIEARASTAALPAHTRFVRLEAARSERPDLQAAAKVVSGGRGVGSKENFAVIYQLADKLGAAVGASRAAVDAGFVPNDLQVGQTGKIIAPDLYIAIGISGAIQHLTGIKDARCIVAINKDGEAPIFEVADLGLVGDLFQLLPELEKALGAQ